MAPGKRVASNPAAGSHSTLGCAHPACTSHLQKPKKMLVKTHKVPATVLVHRQDLHVSIHPAQPCGLSGPKTRGPAVTVGWGSPRSSGRPGSDRRRGHNTAFPNIPRIQCTQPGGEAAVPEQGQPWGTLGPMDGLLPWTAGIFPLLSCLRRFWWDLPL